MDVTLRATPRPSTGSGASRRLRRDGRLPGVVYGAGMDSPVAVAVDRRELVAALSTEAGLNALITLDIEGDAHLTLARELQRHPVRNDLIHIDFVAIRRDQEIHAEVPVTTVGEAPAVDDNLNVSQVLTHLNLASLPGNVPTHVEVDLTSLHTVADTIRAGDIQLPEGVTLVTDPDEPVVVVTAQETALEAGIEAPEAAAAEGAEPAAGEGADAGSGAGSEEG